MASVSHSQLREVASLIELLQDREGDLSVTSLFVDDDSGTNLGYVTWDENAEDFRWVQSS